MERIRKSFSDIFTQHFDGSVEPKVMVRVAGVQIGPGIRVGKGITFAGVNLAHYNHRDFEVEVEEGTGVEVLKGVY